MMSFGILELASNKTLHKAIERCDKRIAQAKNKLRWSRSFQDKDDAQVMIKEQESKKLKIQQQIRFNMVMRDAGRINNTDSLE